MWNFQCFRVSCHFFDGPGMSFTGRNICSQPSQACCDTRQACVFLFLCSYSGVIEFYCWRSGINFVARGTNFLFCSRDSSFVANKPILFVFVFKCSCCAKGALWTRTRAPHISQAFKNRKGVTWASTLSHFSPTKQSLSRQETYPNISWVPFQSLRKCLFTVIHHEERNCSFFRKSIADLTYGRALRTLIITAVEKLKRFFDHILFLNTFYSDCTRSH